ncbi:MAG: secretin N-terminal domain-containing protein [Planctomycetota bacterium]
MFNKLSALIGIIALSALFSVCGYGQNAPGGSGASGGTPPAAEKPAPAPVPEVILSIGGPKIGTFLELIASRANKLIMYDDNANVLKDQKVNVMPESFKVPADKYDSILNSIIDAQLRMRGFVLLRADPVWKIVRIEQARENPGVVVSPSDIDKLPTDDRVVTQVIQFKYIEAQAFSTYMAALRGKGMENSYIIIPENNTVVITDYASNIRRYWEIAKTVDQEGVQFQTENRQLKNTSAIMVKTNLDQNYIPLRFSKKVRGGGLLSAEPRVIADDRTNSLLIIAQAKDMQEMLKIIDVFDAEAPKKENEYYIYKLTNTNAADVQKILDAVFRQSLSALGASIKASEKTISIQADISSNTLIISAPRAMYDEMLELIKKIDIRKMQVLLEVVIAELTDEKMTQLGIELASVKQPGNSVSGFGGTSTGISKLDPTTGGKIPLIPDAPEKGIGSLTVGLWKDTQYNIPFLMQAAQKDTGINLKAAPVLLTNDNSEASIDMSDKAPYFSTTYPGGVGQPAVTSFSGYVDAKISLKITPVISEDNYIRLSIEQTSEQFLGEPDQKTPKTSRTAKTTVTVPDRNTVVIGGLTREVTSKTVSKVPLLGDIPLLGYLFRRETDSVRKYHLCLFIKPNIMKDFSDLIKETKETEKILDEKKKEGVLKTDDTKKK